MARRRRVPITSNGIIAGLQTIADSFGVSRMTIQRWIRDHGFPAAKLPDGHIVTSVTRIKRPASDDAAAGSGSEAMASPVHASHSAPHAAVERDRDG